MDRDPIGTDARHTQRLERLGPGPYSCLFCGVDDPILLIRKPLSWLKARVPKRLLEEHHLVGRNNDPNLTVLLCHNCHFSAHEGYLQAGISMRPEPDPILRVATMLEGLAVFLKILATALLGWAELLRNSRRGRDRE